VREYGVEVDDEAAGKLRLADKNYDVGVETPAGVYRLNDDAQAFWLHKLAERNFKTVTPAIAEELLAFYGNLNAPVHTKKKPAEWERTTTELKELKLAAKVRSNPQTSTSEWRRR
jgi:hypothetical protein